MDHTQPQLPHNQPEPHAPVPLEPELPPRPPEHNSFLHRSVHPESTPPETPAATKPAPVEPQPVVHVLSPRGVEYVFLTIALFTAAIGLGSVLISLVNGEYGFDILAFPVATLLVSVPIFAWLFLRLKKAELVDPQLRRDPSKRRSTQFTQIVAFLVFFFTLIGFLTLLFMKMAGQYDASAVKLVLNTLVILLISGGLLFYYWRDEH